VPPEERKHFNADAARVFKELALEGVLS